MVYPMGENASEVTIDCWAGTGRGAPLPGPSENSAWTDCDYFGALMSAMAS